jgi:hypothetical protein
MAIRQEFLKNYESAEDLLGQGGLLKELTKALVEKAFFHIPEITITQNLLNQQMPIIQLD